MRRVRRQTAYCGRQGGPPSTKYRNRRPNMGRWASVELKRRSHETRHGHSGLCVEANEKNFSFVNESPRRLLSRRAGIEGRGALRSFALATQVESEGDGS